MSMKSWFGLGALVVALGCGDGGGSGKGSPKGDAGGGDGDSVGDGGAVGDGDSVGDGDADGGQVRAPSRQLGSYCERQADCMEPLKCNGDTGETQYVGVHQCTLFCGSDADCKPFGENARCHPTASICEAKCSKDADCPSNTKCVKDGYCENTEHGIPSCGGTAKPCSEYLFDEKPRCPGYEADMAMGCTVVPHAGCNGTPTPCADIASGLDAQTCALFGCDFSDATGRCTGVPSACSTRDHDYCIEGCSLKFTTCEGTVAACNTLAPAVCGQLAGCVLALPGGEPKAVCGDGIIGFGEECDGKNFGLSTTCEERGQGQGTLTCGADCKFDETSCHVCQRCACEQGMVDNGCKETCGMLNNFCDGGDPGPACKACIMERCGQQDPYDCL
ncbi:MAG: hypothetical protein QM778_18880 [Myxococcales bacterium]